MRDGWRRSLTGDELACVVEPLRQTFEFTNFPFFVSVQLFFVSAHVNHIKSSPDFTARPAGH